MTAPAHRELEYADHVAALRREEPALAGELAGFTGVGQVLEWMKRRGLAQTRVDLVGQDEFHYDFLIELEPGGRWLAVGVT
jgi:hypothetical protein